MKAQSKFIYLGCALAAAAALGTSSSQAQGTIDATGLLSSVPNGGAFNYTIALTDASTATSQIGTFWYSWIPGEFFLPAAPSGVITPTGWTGTIVANSIEFNSTAGHELQPGQTLNFSFTDSATPAQMNGPSSTPGEQVGTSFAYGGDAAFSTPSQEFVVTAAPEPSSLALLVLGGLGCLTGGYRKLRAK